jgi:hypothetical protein
MGNVINTERPLTKEDYDKRKRNFHKMECLYLYKDRFRKNDQKLLDRIGNFKKTPEEIDNFLQDFLELENKFEEMSDHNYIMNVYKAYEFERDLSRKEEEMKEKTAQLNDIKKNLRELQKQIGTVKCYFGNEEEYNKFHRYA